MYQNYSFFSMSFLTYFYLFAKIRQLVWLAFLCVFLFFFLNYFTRAYGQFFLTWDIKDVYSKEKRNYISLDIVWKVADWNCKKKPLKGNNEVLCFPARRELWIRVFSSGSGSSLNTYPDPKNRIRNKNFSKIWYQLTFISWSTEKSRDKVSISQMFGLFQQFYD